MKNFHQKTSLLNKRRVLSLEKAFRKAWCLETAHPEYQSRWSEENKALGQCVPTSLIIYDLAGGKLLLDIGNDHVWNELPDGTWQDFSREQFKKGVKFKVDKYLTKEQLLSKTTTAKVKQRYELLCQRLKETGLS